MPGHSSFGKGLPHLTIAACGGVLDPTQDATYEMLAKFLAEMATPNALFVSAEEVGNQEPDC